MEKLDPKEEIQLRMEAERLRRMAVIGVALSIGAAIVCVMTVPFVYNYVQRVETVLQNEAEFCRAKRDSVVRELTRTQRRAGTSNRQKRHEGTYAGYSASYGTYESVPLMQYKSPEVTEHVEKFQGKEENFQQCCGCGFGAPGEAGPPGQNGHDGRDGHPGPDGNHGSDLHSDDTYNMADQFCFECPPAPAGPPGPPGLKGIPGVPGKDGETPQAGQPGIPGPQGPPGPRGMPGERGDEGEGGPDGIPMEKKSPPGPRGPSGPPGPQGPQGKEGRPGTQGPPGELGQPGDDGIPGVPGKSGPPGKTGAAGARGPAGPCSHCPNPRTAPGY